MGTKQIITFRDFMSGSYKRKRYKYKNIMQESVGVSSYIDSMIHTYLALGVMGTVLIGAVLLENILCKRIMYSAKLLSDGIHYGVRMEESDSSAMHFFAL